MPELLRMPEVAANTTEAVLLRWAVPVDAAFKARDTIATVETAKAVVDIEAEQDGVLLATLVSEGAEVEVGAPIALLAEPGEQVPDLQLALAEAGVTAPSADAKSRLALDVPEADREPSAPARPIPVDQPAASSGGQAPTSRVFASPLARRLARDAGLALAEIPGSGPHLRVVRRDVETAIALRATDTAEPATALAAGAAEGASSAYTERPHTRARRALAARLLESKQTTPHFYLRGRVRADALLRVREELNERAAGRVSLNDLVVKAVAHAHQRVPDMNVLWTADALRAFSSVDVAVAVATATGLVTPVLRGVESRTVSDVASAMKDFAERARAGALRQKELEGGSITVTNLGMFGTEEFAAIINPPQAAILAVGAVTQEAAVSEGCVAIASIMRLTLSVDHRPVDGVTAARWMAALTAVLEQPMQLLA